MLTNAVLSNLSGDKKCEAYVLWDTGATHSVVTEDVIEVLGLERICDGFVDSATERTTSGIYMCSLQFADGSKFDVSVFSGSNLKTDMLIGMDVISQGDFRLYHDSLDNLVLEFDRKG